MPYSLCAKRFLLGCIIAFTLTARFALAAWFSLLGSFGALVGLVSVLSLLSAIVEACRFAERLDSDDSTRPSQSLLAESWIKRRARSEAQKSISTDASTTVLKKAA